MEQNVKDDERKEMLEKTNETINGSNTFLSGRSNLSFFINNNRLIIIKWNL